VILLVVGDGKLGSELKTLVRELNIQDRVKFLGNVSNDQLPKYLKLADVFVRPSRSEGLGTAFLEAMAAGTPIVATRVGGIKDFLIDRETGIVCLLDDHKSVASSISEILRDEKLREKIIKNGKSLVINRYDWEKIALQYKMIYMDKAIHK
jgi:glycosyltransferase involved in cell wall biosynthesis